MPDDALLLTIRKGPPHVVILQSSIIKGEARFLLGDDSPQQTIKLRNLIFRNLERMLDIRIILTDEDEADCDTYSIGQARARLGLSPDVSDQEVIDHLLRDLDD